MFGGGRFLDVFGELRTLDEATETMAEGLKSSYDQFNSAFSDNQTMLMQKMKNKL